LADWKGFATNFDAGFLDHGEGMRALIVHSESEATSLELGRHLGECLEAGDVLALWGELGAGKTLLTRGIARGLGISPEVRIASPTFTFINEYEGRLHLYHIDLYRVVGAGELDTLPWREALFGSGVAVVEWPERLGQDLPDERFDIQLQITGDDTRTITIRAHGVKNLARLESWSQEW
jgi:tRNA threonylcarbamoyladenosine biosynthesis protein TsaE